MMQAAPPGRQEGRMAGGLSVEGQGAEDSADRSMLRVKGLQPQGHTPAGGTQVVNSSGTTAVFVEVMFSGEGRRTGGLLTPRAPKVGRVRPGTLRER